MSEFQDLKTVRDYWRYAVTQFERAELFYGHGTDNAWDEAWFLLLYCLHLPVDTQVALVADARLTLTERQNILNMIKLRVEKRLPLPYLTHEVWFAGLKMYVDERVLVPRSPIAELIQEQFSPWVDPEKVHTILDLCTGSGCIAIACAYAFLNAHVDAVDISTEALEVAARNVNTYELQDRVTLIQSDLLKNLTGKKYDIIVSNPPYVDEAEIKAMPAEFKSEPLLGLASGKDGLDATKLILKTAAEHLHPGGVLIVEVGVSQAALIQQFPELPFTWLDFEKGGQGVFLLTKEMLDSVGS
ncbi:MAG: 50S ribosomal protein L3 N(5)-glutamine methyltransferase [Gammaproteobacteria bacterium]|nr:50S ribosomal protein L3 N(5)-glutamine methyltransferase [Gammaproteobacteria bacterium]